MYAFRLFGFPNYETTLETIRSTIPLIMNRLMPNMSIDLDMIMTCIFPHVRFTYKPLKNVDPRLQLRVNI